MTTVEQDLAKQRIFLFTENCAVRELTADGKPFGRCWYHLKSGTICPTHGDVSDVQKTYREFGALTSMKRRKHEPKKSKTLLSRLRDFVNGNS